MTGARVKLLAIEDDVRIQRFLATALDANGYDFLAAATGAEGLRLAATRQPEIVLVDLGLPDLSGQDVIRELRGWFRGPILVLSARSQESEKVLALDNGADDYVTKPFGIGELLARLRVAQRHQNDRADEAPPTVIEVGPLSIDRAARRVRRDGADIHLTPIEYKLLAVLATHAGKVVTHRQLLREVWGPTHVESPQYLRIYMRSLRQKVETDPTRPQLLLTDIGVGYRLADDTTG